MMEFKRHINRRLHEEHLATLALWSKLEVSFATGRPDPTLMRSAAAALAGEIDRHFAFEEAQLFPRLAAGGEGDMVELLAEEHVVIRTAATSFIALVKADPADPKIRPVALELAERLASHVEKEEMSMLPALEDLLDESADEELTSQYVTT
jgi:hemerythrin-like domain-containing protein